MKQKTAGLIAAGLLFFGGISFAQIQLQRQQAAPQSTKTTVRIQSPRTLQLTPEMQQRLRAVPHRTLLINSLMASPATRGVLESAARAVNMPVNQLATRSLNGQSATGNPTIINLNFQCLGIDWRAGVKFTPWVKYPECKEVEGRISMPLANFTAGGISSGNRSLSDLATYDLIYLVAGQDSYARLNWVVLPNENATYVITIQAAVWYATGPQKTLQDLLSAGRVKVLLQRGWVDPANNWATNWNEITMTTLLDGSGYAGIINYPSDAQNPLCNIDFKLPGSNEIGISFWGITITRL